MKTINNEKRRKVLFFLLVLMSLLLVIYATIKFMPLIKMLINSDTRMQAKDEIASMGIYGVFLIILLQVIQIVVAVIPGQPMEIISGMLYGTFGGLIVSLIGIFIGTAIVFVIVRKVGIEFIKLFFKEESINKIKNSKIYKNPSKFEMLMLIIFCIPLIPKDIFIYLGGLSPVRTNRFLLIATVGRIPGLFLTVFAGNRFSEGNLQIVVILIAIILIAALIGYYVIPRMQDNMEKEESNKSKIKCNKKVKS